MGKLFKKLKIKGDVKKTIYKITGIFFSISVLLSIVFSYIVDKSSIIVAFSDNIFFASVVSFTVYIILNGIKNTSKLKKKTSSKDEVDRVDDNNKSFEKDESLIAITNSFLINGIICIIFSIIFAFISMRW